jgi:peptide/nickel transport system permease protein
MLVYIIKRIFLLIPVLLGISIITFLAIYFSPGDPADITLRALLDTDIPPKEAVAELGEEMGLDAPLHIQYIRWVNRVLHGDLGYSFQTRRSTLEEISTALPATVMLAVTSMFISILIAVPFGILSAVKQSSMFDRAALLGSLLAVSVPDFFIAIILILIFALHFDVFPVAGYGGIEYLILPSLALAIGMAAITTRLMRTSMAEVLGENYITTARAKGLKERQVIVKHSLRNALIPVITYMGTQFGYMFGGTVIIETIFMWPGIGRLLVESVYARDFLVIQGCVLVIALIYVFINLVIDVSYAFIDPRIRYGGKDGA